MNVLNELSNLSDDIISFTQEQYGIALKVIDFSFQKRTFNRGVDKGFIAFSLIDEGRYASHIEMALDSHYYNRDIPVLRITKIRSSFIRGRVLIVHFQIWDPW
ncbi:hypothetical protein [Weissella sp. MSCH1]|uniref:hypothetical protein n=1 Tax=Weissella sp. MSCH1 TaxID=3383343 RepID=UPI003896D070